MANWNQWTYTVQLEVPNYVEESGEPAGKVTFWVADMSAAVVVSRSPVRLLAGPSPVVVRRGPVQFNNNDGPVVITSR